MTSTALRIARSLSLFPFALLAACSSSSSDGAGAAAATFEVLSTTEAHYGKTLGEWTADWWRWYYEMPQPEGDAGACVNPSTDATGANCAAGQSGDVFFLAGDMGGKVVRDQCVVPATKAIYFPIINFAADNAGIPVDQQYTEAQLLDLAQAQLAKILVSNLTAEVDGVPLTDLERFKTQPTKFTYTLPPEPNTYSCNGIPGVTGKIEPAYGAGYGVLLAPLSAGAHRIRFSGFIAGPPSDFSLDVTYELTVQ